jgi:hypothetical protein
MAKLRAAEVAQRIAERAVQCGGWGYVSDLPVEKWYRDAKSARARAGMLGPRMARRAPRPVLRLAITVLGPPEPSPRRPAAS